MRISDGGAVCLDLKIPASTKDLFGSLQNSDGALKLSASAMDFLPQLVENPCIKKSNLRCVLQFFCYFFSFFLNSKPRKVGVNKWVFFNFLRNSLGDVQSLSLVKLPVYPYLGRMVLPFIS